MNQRETTEAKARLALRPEPLYKKTKTIIEGDPNVSLLIARRLDANLVIEKSTFHYPPRFYAAMAIRAQASFCCTTFEPK